jgi:acetyl esterase/lipase
MEKTKRTALFICSFVCMSAFAFPAHAQDDSTPKNNELPPWKRGVYADSVPVPTYSGIRYGEKHRNVLDFWQAPSDQPTPVVVVIHGGGWNGGAKEQLDIFVDTGRLLKAGISVATINYRLIKHSKDEEPYVKGPLSDAARAVQFLRSKADEWNIDKTRFAATGGSAGACTSLWLAYHDDLADPASEDPVARESTRLMCVAPLRAQTTLDPKQMKEWIPNSKYGAHAFGLESFDQFLAERDNLLPFINEYSPYALLDANDPPTYMFYRVAPAIGKPEKDPTHSAVFGVKLQERCRELGVPCELVYPGAPDVKHETPTDYLIATLSASEK